MDSKKVVQAINQLNQLRDKTHNITNSCLKQTKRQKVKD